MKNFLIIFAFLNLFVTALIAEEGSVDVYLAGSKFNIKDDCKPICRKLENGYKSRVTGFDPFRGITTCDVFDIEKGIILSDETKSINKKAADSTSGSIKDKIESGITADTFNQTCVEKTNIKKDYNELNITKQTIIVNESIDYKDEFTFSRFITSLFTLDQDIVDFDNTTKTNKLVLKNTSNLNNTQINDSDPKAQATSNILNKSNLVYFSAIFTGLQKLHNHLQYFIFLYIAAFFLFMVFSKKLLSKLQKQQQDVRSLELFIVPVIMVVLCFVPIPTSQKLQTTPLQLITQFFIQHSVKIADHISTIGVDSYLKKLYSSVGAYSIEEEKKIVERKESLEAAIKFYKVGIEECRIRYPKKDISTFQVDENILKAIETMDTNQENVKQDYRASACRDIERSLITNERELKSTEIQLKALKNAWSNQELETTLKQIHKKTETSNQELGWFFSSIMPSISVVVENVSVISEQQEFNVTEKNIEIQQNENNSIEEKGIIENFIDDTSLGAIIGNLSYFILPGAGEIYKNVYAMSPKVTSFITNAAKDIPIVGGIVDTTVGIMARIAILNTVASIYESILKYLPVIVTMVASMIAIVVYLVELLNFYYFQPFIVAYSVTMQRKHKIIDYLLFGISIFAKPMLIVFFISLSIFFLSLIQDFFGYLVDKQIGLLDDFSKGNLGFINGFSLVLFSTLLSIITSIASAFLMWKLIIEGSNFVLKLLGLDSGASDSLNSSISGKLERHSFQV